MALAQVIHQGPYLWFSVPRLAPGADHTWTLRPAPDPLWGLGLVATVHATEGIDGPTGVERRLRVASITSIATRLDEFLMQVTVRNVGANPVFMYGMWLSFIRIP